MLVYQWHTRGSIGEGETIESGTVDKSERERESFWKICIETQKMARTFDGWMEFAVKWDQAVIVENLKTFREKFVEDKHGTERKCLSMTNDL